MASVTNQIQNTKDKAKDTASQAYDKAKDTASQAYDKGKEITSNVADKTKDIASNVSDKAHQYAAAAGDKAESAVESIGGSMKSAANTLRQNLPDKGMLGDASESVAGALESGGKYLEEKGLSGIGSDMTDVIKKHPVPAVLLALGLGYLIACSTSRS